MLENDQSTVRLVNKLYESLNSMDGWRVFENPYYFFRTDPQKVVVAPKKGKFPGFVLA